MMFSWNPKPWGEQRCLAKHTAYEVWEGRGRAGKFTSCHKHPLHRQILYAVDGVLRIATPRGTAASGKAIEVAPNTLHILMFQTDCEFVEIYTDQYGQGRDVEEDIIRVNNHAIPDYIRHTMEDYGFHLEPRPAPEAIQPGQIVDARRGIEFGLNWEAMVERAVAAPANPPQGGFQPVWAPRYEEVIAPHQYERGELRNYNPPGWNVENRNLEQQNMNPPNVNPNPPDNW